LSFEWFEIHIIISFGPRESIAPYDTFYLVFEVEFGIKLGNYILESNQGRALKAVGAGHPRHLFCTPRIAVGLPPSWGI
jgi:hypothetical protein